MDAARNMPNLDSPHRLRDRNPQQRQLLKSQMTMLEEPEIVKEKTVQVQRLIKKATAGVSDYSSSSDEEPPSGFVKTTHRVALGGAAAGTTISHVLRVAVSQEELSAPYFEAPDAERIKDLVAAHGNGYFLRGWRIKFDPEGTLDCPFSQFCKTCAEIGFVSKPSDLYEKGEYFTHIQLTQVNPRLGALLEAFRRWISMSFNGHSEFFDAFDQQRSGNLQPEGFVAACAREGFVVQNEEAQELFSSCDVKSIGTVVKDDVVFLEKDPGVRSRELVQIKKRKQYEVQKHLVDSFNEELNSALPPSNRHSIRPWIAKHFEDIPEVERQRRQTREKRRVAAGLDARVQFLRHVRRLHGNEVTAWRRALDREARFEVTEARFRQICRQLDFRGDVDALWYSLDPDNDGTLGLEQLSPRAADLLAHFRLWAVRRFGSCVAFFESDESVARRKKKHPHREGDTLIDKNMTAQHLAQVLKAYQCPLLEGKDGRAKRWFLCRSLDLNGCGIIYGSDLEWLDKWEPSEWLTAEPNQKAWEELIAILLRRFGHLLRAWRFELDADNSNRLSWVEFRDACERLKFRGEIGGAWRWLDKNLMGWIDLASVDRESSEILQSFKEWAETRFGTVELAFKAIGNDNGAAAFTYGEMRAACTKFKYVGNTRLLFDCLTKNGETVSYKDASFLSAWGVHDADNVTNLKKTVDELWREMLALCPTNHKKAPLAVCEGGSPSREQSRQQSQRRFSPGIAWGTISTKAALASLLGTIGKDESSQSGTLGVTARSSPESMLSVPDNHCSPMPTFPGAPYALPVLLAPTATHQETMFQLHARKPGSAGKIVQSSSQPMLHLRSENSPMKQTMKKSCTHAGALSVEMDSFRTPASKVGCPNGRVLKASKGARQLSRKRDLIGSIGGNLSNSHHSFGLSGAEYQP